MRCFKTSTLSICLISASVFLLADQAIAQELFHQPYRTDYATPCTDCFDENSILPQAATWNEQPATQPIGESYFQNNSNADNPWFVRLGVGVLLFGEGSTIRANGQDRLPTLTGMVGHSQRRRTSEARPHRYRPACQRSAGNNSVRTDCTHLATSLLCDTADFNLRWRRNQLQRSIRKQRRLYSKPRHRQRCRSRLATGRRKTDQQSHQLVRGRQKSVLPHASLRQHRRGWRRLRPSSR